MDSIDPKKIAEGLTETQRRSLLVGPPTNIQSFGRARNTLVRMGIAEHRHICGADAFALTDLGLAVRSHLLGENK